jgi:hypothetical protein
MMKKVVTDMIIRAIRMVVSFGGWYGSTNSCWGKV